MSTEDAVVVTGLGVATSLGLEVESMWEAVLSGRSGISTIEQFPSEAFKISIGGEIKAHCQPPLTTEMSLAQVEINRSARFAHWAALKAWQDAGLGKSSGTAHRRAVCIGAGVFPPLEQRLAHVRVQDPRNHQKMTMALRHAYQVQPSFSAQLAPDAIASALAGELGCTGQVLAVQAACASGTQAIGHAASLIHSGEADVVVTGGCDSMMSALSMTGFQLLGALSKNPDPSTASRPFDATRDGFVMSEGAGILILESHAHASARGANVYAELRGYGSSLDAWDFTDLHPEGRGACSAMQFALDAAGLHPTQIGYINAHGTSTLLNDAVESAAIRTVFGAYADHLAVSSTKSQLGHLICAAGAIECVLCVLALRDQIAPPTINYHHPDPQCDLDYIPGRARAMPLDFVLSNSFGFGGQNGTLVLGRERARSRQ